MEYSHRDCQRAPGDFPGPRLAVLFRCEVPFDTGGSSPVDQYRFAVLPNLQLWRSPVEELNCYHEKYREAVPRQLRLARLVSSVVVDFRVEFQELEFVGAVFRDSP